MSLKSFYGNKSYNPFGTKGPFYSKDVGHRGDDYGVATGGGIPSWVEGPVILVGYSTGLGYVIAVRDTLTGVYMSQAHLKGSGGSRAPKLSSGLVEGDNVKLGQIVGYASGRADDHGTLWDGSHCHTTAGWTARVAYGEGVINPRPFIVQGIEREAERGNANTSPATPQPTPSRPAPQEEDDMFNEDDRKVLNGIVAAVSARIQQFQELIIDIIREEGTDARVFFNEASGIYAIGGLTYWWELGSDINKATMQETWDARKSFGEATLGHYRRRGLAQKYTHSVSSEDFDFIRMLCLNFPSNIEGETIAKIEDIVKEIPLNPVEENK